MDIIICQTVLMGWVIFGIIHVLCFRFLQDRHVFPAIILTTLAGLLLTGFFSYTKHTLFSAIVAGVIYLMGVGNYILCIWGPLTTSIRIRLIRQLALNSEGQTRDDLIKQYNEEVMLAIRLERLMGNGDVVLAQGLYRLVNKPNVFMVLKKLSIWLNVKKN